MISPETESEQAPTLPPPNGLVRHYLDSLGYPDDLYQRSVLDVGCGEGRNTIAFAEHGFGLVLGIDSDTEAIARATQFKIAKGLGSDACRFIEMNAANIAHLQDNYSAVVNSEMLHMLPRDEQTRLLRNMRERTRTGGVNLVSGYMLSKAVETPAYKDRLLFPGQLARTYEAAGWRVTFKRDIERRPQIINGKERISSKSFLIARRP